MGRVSNRAIDLIEIGLSATTPAAAGRSFFQALQPLGVRSIWARAYALGGRPTGNEHIYSRLSPPGWENLYAEKRYREANYMLRGLRQRATAFRWSEVSLVNATEREVSRALLDFGIGDGLAIPCHGPNGYLGVVSLAFERLSDIDPADQAAIQIASHVLHDRMRVLAKADKPRRHPALSERERDCLAFIADGRSDPEIADLLGVALPTVVTHVKNARLKLGARTRAQAVARHLLLSEFDGPRFLLLASGWTAQTQHDRLAGSDDPHLNG